MTSPELMEKTVAQTAAENLVEQMLNRPEQIPLFDTAGLLDKFKESERQRLERVNPDKVVVAVELVEEYRVMAAFLGAGFHASQYDDVMYKYNDPDEVGRFVVGCWYTSGRIKDRYPAHNAMVDEVEKERFVSVVPATSDEGYHYVTSEADLREIFEFDYSYLASYRNMKPPYDFLFERED